MKTVRVALVYDRVNKWGGAERVLLALHEIWPEAPLYTAVYNPQTAPWAEVFRVIPSFLNKFPLSSSHHEWYPLLMPIAFESFDFSQFDLVISLSSEAAKGIITKPETCHICYCLTPTRYLHHQYENYFVNGIEKTISRPMIGFLKRWDLVAAQRPDHFLAISQTVKKRIKKYYGRESEVVYPPVTLSDFKKKMANGKNTSKKEKYFLLVSRLVPYKRVDIAIRAFNRLGLPLKIIGVGSEMRRLKGMAKVNIEFLGFVPEEELVSYYQDCQALIFPQEEDFGLVPLEVQACGKPVIAYRGGGATETVIEGKTGWFFYPQTAEALIKKVQEFKRSKSLIKTENCQENARRFSQENFARRFKRAIEKLVTI